MDVVATSKGFYGNQLRERGDLFTLKNGKTDFSEKWMAKAATAEAKQLLRENASDGKGLSAAQIAMEEAEATGRAGAHKAEMAEMRDQIAQLTAMLGETAKTAPAAVEKAAAKVEAEAEEVKETDVEETEVEKTDDAAPTERKTRRARR